MAVLSAAQRLAVRAEIADYLSSEGTPAVTFIKANLDAFIAAVDVMFEGDETALVQSVPASNPMRAWCTANRRQARHIAALIMLKRKEL